MAPDATVEQLVSEEWLKARLPALLEEFRRDVEVWVYVGRRTMLTLPQALSHTLNYVALVVLQKSWKAYAHGRVLRGVPQEVSTAGVSRSLQERAERNRGAMSFQGYSRANIVDAFGAFYAIHGEAKAIERVTRNKRSMTSTRAPATPAMTRATRRSAAGAERVASVLRSRRQAARKSVR